PVGPLGVEEVLRVASTAKPSRLAILVVDLHGEHCAATVADRVLDNFNWITRLGMASQQRPNVRGSIAVPMLVSFLEHHLEPTLAFAAGLLLSAARGSPSVPARLEVT